jgi:hypothetical protein
MGGRFIGDRRDSPAVGPVVRVEIVWFDDRIRYADPSLALALVRLYGGQGSFGRAFTMELANRAVLQVQ